ncbi:MAG: ABC transporter permease [Candidatus Omnitrophica bacterium]|nr:ABC transporter permease [Candidatus Omnitrophota bacterium]MCM8816768.1 ABC transporter permease [Candidatus Omnitrophota bacterium]
MKINFLHLIRIVRHGWKNIWLHRLRSLLTVLGIVFGVASVIAMLAIGEGASFEARKMIESLGSNNIIIRSVKLPADAKTQQASLLGVYGLTDRDMRKLETIPSVVRIIPAWEMEEDVWYYGKNISARVIGTLPEYQHALNLSIKTGRFFDYTDIQKSLPVAIIGSTVRTSLFPAEDPIGKSIKIRSSYFTIIGIAGEKVFAGASESFVAEDMNIAVYVPISTTKDFFGEYEVKRTTGGIRSWERNWVQYHRFVVQVSDTDKILATASLVSDILSQTHKKQDYQIIVPLELLRQAERTKRIFNIVLGSIAAISLIVGGIGIMNIMLAIVTERTKEIGIRRAVGARKRDIINQFLTESVILSASGGFIGIMLGILIPKAVTKFAGMMTIITPWSILLSFSISVAVGIGFGLYPARKAAELDPIQALRYE